MSIYKKVKIPKKNLPETLNSEKFKKLWIKAFSLQEEDVSNLYVFLKDFYIYVEKSLKNYNQPNYFLISLLHLIHRDSETALLKLKTWMKAIDIFHELNIIIFERLNAISKIPKKSRPLMAEYYFVLDLKYALSKKIKKSNTHISYCDFAKYDYYTIPDPLLNLNSWQEYLLKLMYLGYNNTEISEITQLSRKTIINERKKLYVYV